MNHHFSSRVLSLVLAVVFLFSAAGVSFLILFKGTPAFAADPSSSSGKNAECQGYELYKAVSDTSDTLEPYPSSALNKNEIFAIKVTVFDPELAKYPDLDKSMDFINGIKVRVKNDGFSTVAPSKAKPLDFSIEEGIGGVYTILLGNVKYTGESQDLQFSVTYPPNYPYPDPDSSASEGATKPTILRVANISVGINECIIPSSSSEYIRDDRNDNDDDSSSSRPDIAPPTPTLIVSSFNYGGQSVTAAGNFNLKLTVKNTSKKLPIDNIVMKVTVPEAFTMNGSSNTFYIEKLTKDSSKELSLDLSVKPNAEPISHAIKISFGFEAVIDEARKALTAEQEISIPVGQLDRFSVQPIEIPQEIFMGEDTSFEVSFINKGKTTVYNITAEIAGEGITQPGQRQFIGNLEGGKEDSADFLLGASAPGPLTGEVVITYEDSNMHVTELRQPFNTNVIQMDMGKPDGGDMEVNAGEQPPAPAQWYQQVPVWGWMVGGVVALILLAFIVKLVRARREKKLEEQDEDF